MTEKYLKFLPWLVVAGALVRVGESHLAVQATWYLLVVGMFLCVARIPRLPGVLLVSVGLWVGSGLLSAFLGNDPADALRTLGVTDVLLVGGVLVGLGVSTDALKRRNDQFFIVTIVGLAIVISEGWLDMLIGGPGYAELWLGGTAAGSLGAARSTAEWGALAVAYLGLFAIRNESRQTLVMVAAVVVAAFSVTTGSWSAVLAVGAFAVANALFSHPGTERNMVALAGLSVLGLAFAGADFSSFSLRYYLHNDAVAALVGNPFGTGPGLFDFAFDGLLSATADYYTREAGAFPLHAHQFFVEAMVERGIVGLAAAIALAVVVGLRLWKLRSDDRMRGFAGIGAVLTVFVLAANITAVPAIWFATGIFAGLVFADNRADAPLPRPFAALLTIICFLVFAVSWRHSLADRDFQSYVSERGNGNFDAAEEALLEAMKRRPDDTILLLHLCRLRVAWEVPAAALEICVRGSKMRPDLEDWYEQAAIIALQTKDQRLAHSVTEGWFRSPGFHSERVYVSGALAAAMEQDGEMALKVLQQGIAAHPASIRLLRLYSQYLIGVGRVEDGLKVLEKVASHPDRTEEDVDALARAKTLYSLPGTATTTEAPGTDEGQAK